jgi:hypothetical protein
LIADLVKVVAKEGKEEVNMTSQVVLQSIHLLGPLFIFDVD